MKIPDILNILSADEKLDRVDIHTKLKIRNLHTKQQEPEPVGQQPPKLGYGLGASELVSSRQSSFLLRRLASQSLTGVRGHRVSAKALLKDHRSNSWCLL